MPCLREREEVAAKVTGPAELREGYKCNLSISYSVRTAAFCCEMGPRETELSKFVERDINETKT